MARPATSKLKVNPPLGSLPVLQYCALEQLQIDETYQRGLETSGSQALIRKIAIYWDWGLCQPLFVARRADGALYVVDGQHRLAAARLRGDIWQLPCVVASFASAEEEAASFVALNQMRRPLSRLDLFKAAIAANDFEATQIAMAVEDAGLHISNHASTGAMKVGHVANVGGLAHCYRVHGLQVLTTSLTILALAYNGQVLRYAGSLFPGIAAIVAAEMQRNADFAGSDLFDLMWEMVAGAEQSEWYRDIGQAKAADPNLNRKNASTAVFKRAWAECTEAMLEDDAELEAAA